MDRVQAGRARHGCPRSADDVKAIWDEKDRAKKQTSCPGKDFYRYLEDGQFVGWVKQTLDGKGAEAYVRQRKELQGGDYDRQKRQQQYLFAVMQKVKAKNMMSNETWGKLVHPVEER